MAGKNQGLEHVRGELWHVEQPAGKPLPCRAEGENTSELTNSLCVLKHKVMQQLPTTALPN